MNTQWKRTSISLRKKSPGKSMEGSVVLLDRRNYTSTDRGVCALMATPPCPPTPLSLTPSPDPHIRKNGRPRLSLVCGAGGANLDLPCPPAHLRKGGLSGSRGRAGAAASGGGPAPVARRPERPAPRPTPPPASTVRELRRGDSWKL